MNLSFYKKDTFPDLPTGSILFNSENQKVYLKDHSGWVCYSTELIPEKILATYIGYGTTYGASQTVQLSKDKFYIIGRAESLTITLPDGADTDCQEYNCQFYIPNTEFKLTLPDNVKYQNGVAPTFDGNSCIQLIICNGCATYGIFK